MRIVSGLLIVTLFAPLVGCGLRSSGGEILEVTASPQDGFQFPYFLWLPEREPSQAATFLLVEPNNTGTVSDDFEKHRRAARKMVERSSLGASLARELQVPFLVPVFPRPETDWKNYTHALDRDTMLLSEGPLVRIDRQLDAMIEHARSLLAERGMAVQEQVLMNGFSASGTFANRFAFLHPERLRAVAGGGLNGIPMLPVERLGDVALPYPLGLDDFEAVAGEAFRRDAWSALPQLLYMGAEDDNDAVAYSDAFSDEEREIVHAVLGEAMMPDRWDTCRGVYEASGAEATLRTYDGIGHGTDGRIHREIVEFFRSAMKDR